MQIEPDYSLTTLNTMRLKSAADFFIALTSLEQIPQIVDFIQQKQCKFLCLGGGSNLLLPEHYHGLVIHNQLLGIDCISDNLHCDDTECPQQSVLIQVMAGENWDHFVAYCLKNNWFGLENLSLIPGTVGATPIQNIGAYGVEVKDFIEYVEVYDIKTKTIIKINNQECNFSYRNSRFKTEQNFIVTAVVFKLLKAPKLNMSYGDIAKNLKEIKNPSALDLRECVINIRQSKLPDPGIIANVGSFFHNPILLNSEIEKLRLSYPKLPVYTVDSTHSKVSAGWLIDNLGLKGYRLGNVGVYDKQALVLVNHADATKTEILAFAKLIQDTILANYGIKLNIEPIIVEG